MTDLPMPREMPMIQVTAVGPRPLPVPRPRYDGVTDWPGKGGPKYQGRAIFAAAFAFLIMLLASIVAGLIQAIF
jgi:hypothetical protein